MSRSLALAALAALVLVGLLALPSAARAERVTVFAAASLTNALGEVAEVFEAETGTEVVLSLAGSSALARQIEAGAPADIFISANPDWMDRLAEAGRLAPGTRTDLLANRLVLIGRAGGDSVPAPPPPLEIDTGTDIAARLGDGRLAMALVDAVPAGIYGKAALIHLGQWERLAPRVAQTDNVRAALALVASGAAPVGIVYATDAQVEDRVVVLGRFPEDSHPPILYPAAALADRARPEVLRFLDALRGAGARAIFEAHGFTALPR